ncbi:unnamed protein product [Gongylonema pulchrum]|uniref:Saposin B-type domain-containing protein n=1 Tax=Gongylonema pulchrum TaxID=637853 RepID=A0A183D0D6_9BILA|nr:unnamed protein product [Gongylonema pulchrum]
MLQYGADVAGDGAGAAGNGLGADQGGVQEDEGERVGVCRCVADRTRASVSGLFQECGRGDPMDGGERDAPEGSGDRTLRDVCAKGSTVAVVEDVLQASSVRRCEQLFAVVEEHLVHWKTSAFCEPCKNMILRMCNDLLKRLSRTVQTGFCGRILVLLARALPLCEKSGLNLVSHFNLDNVTRYDDVQAECCSAAADATGDVSDVEVGEIPERLVPFFGCVVA